MEERTIEMYDGKVWGIEVSERGKECGYLDYRTLAEMVDNCILNNTIRYEVPGEWEVVNGNPDILIHQEYIISRHGYDVLSTYTDELVFYNDRLNLYIWAVDHYGTSWDYVLTDVKLV